MTGARDERLSRDLDATLARRLAGTAIAPVLLHRQTPGNAIFLTEIDGAPVVIKRYFGSASAETVRNLRAEMDLLAPTMLAGSCQVTRLLHAFPDDGIAVLALAPGEPFGEVLSRAVGARRSALFQQAGEWLARYQSLRRRPGTFGPGFWLERAKRTDTHGLSKTDRERTAALLARLARYAQASRGQEIVRAATHGDFVSLNLNHDGTTLYGFDIQGTCWQAAARDVARFLAWEAINTPPSTAPRRFGIVAADLDAFLASGVLDAASAERVLPVLIGEQLLHRFVENHADPDQRAAARAAIESYAQAP